MMKTNKEVLSSVLKTTQMGQLGIRSVLEHASQPGLRAALHSQLNEYDTIETEAHRLASQRGWSLPELAPGVKLMSDMMTRMQLAGSSQPNGKIADMMIMGSTKGLVKSCRNLRHQAVPDQSITALSEKLMETERNNIRQMQGFL